MSSAKRYFVTHITSSTWSRYSPSDSIYDDHISLLTGSCLTLVLVPWCNTKSLFIPLYFYFFCQRIIIPIKGITYHHGFIHVLWRCVASVSVGISETSILDSCMTVVLDTRCSVNPAVWNHVHRIPTRIVFHLSACITCFFQYWNISWVLFVWCFNLASARQMQIAEAKMKS